MPKTKATEVTFDKIRQWVDNPDADDLSQKDKDIYERWTFAYDQLVHERTSAVVNRMMRKFDLSKAQAYLDITNCKKLLNPLYRKDTEWLRNFIIDDNILQIKVAKGINDAKAWQKANANLIRMYAIEKADKEGIDPNLLGNNSYYVMLNNGGETRKLDLDKIAQMDPGAKEKMTDYLFEDIDNDKAEFLINS